MRQNLEHVPAKGHPTGVSFFFYRGTSRRG